MKYQFVNNYKKRNSFAILTNISIKMNSTDIKNVMTGVHHELVGFIIALTGDF